MTKDKGARGARAASPDRQKGQQRRNAKPRASGYAHLKTGSLNEVVAVAGYVHAPAGKRYVLVAIVNHPNAKAARPAIEAMVDWASK